MSSVSEAYKIVEREKLSKTILSHHKSLIAFADYIELAIRCDLVWLFFKSHICEEGGAHLRISFRHTLINSEKPKKSDFWKNEKNCFRYHDFTHVHQKPQSYEEQFLRYRARQNILSFWATLTTQKNKILKKMKKTSGYCSILNLCNQKHDHMTHA